MMIRTAEEIKNKIKDGFSTDVMGWFSIYDIMTALPFEEVVDELSLEFLQQRNAKEVWEEEVRLKTREDVIRVMKNYLEFAWDKANNERGLSADRSIHHYIAWAWLIDDELYEKIVEMYENNYYPYGKPILQYIEEWLKNN